MEFFGFASGNSSTGPTFPFLQESVLKNYPAELTGHPALSSLPMFHYDFVSMDLSTIYQGFVDSYMSAMQTPLARGISAGIIAAAVIYCTWNMSHIWNTDIILSKSDVESASKVREATKNKDKAGSKRKNNGEPALNKATSGPPVKSSTAIVCMSETNIVVSEQLSGATDKCQRQLIDALCKLDNVRCQLNELESDKELLTAEIQLRKKITQKLQVENSSEREKRQQAELRMEMMEIENSQLRHLRKELAIKTGQIEKLENFIRDKDYLQTKLFDDNVVLPRTIAEARAKEFRSLQIRIHELQAEVDSTKQLVQTNAGYQSTKSSCSLCHKESYASPSSPMICEAPLQAKNNITETSITLAESINSERCPNAKRKFAEWSPNIIGPPVKHPLTSKSKTSPVLILPNNSLSNRAININEMCRIIDCKPAINVSITSSTSDHKPEDLINTYDAVSNKGVGVFAQIRALISGFRDSSSETEFVSQFESSVVLNEQLSRTQRTDIINNSEQNKDYPLSDGQSSVFMSASGGSCTSDTDHQRGPVLSTSKSANKKLLPVKRLSRYKRDRRRNKDKVSKRKLAAHHVTGQAPTLNTVNPHESASDSSNWSHKSTVKNYPIAAKTLSNPKTKSSGDSKEAMGCSEENDADSGDSWIVIMPAST